MSERTTNKNIWIKRTAGVLVAPIAAVALSSCSSGEAKCEPRATVTVTAEAKPSSAPANRVEAPKQTMTNTQVDAAFAQGVAALKGGDIKGAEKIYSEELLNGGSALGTEKDYDGDGHKEYPYESLKEQIDWAK